MIIHNKVTSEGGGGTKSPSQTLYELIGECDLIFAYKETPEVKCGLMKNKFWDPQGDINLEEIVKVFAFVLAKKFIGRNMKLFRVSIEKEIEEAVTGILRKYEVSHYDYHI
jgi:hypothetical protein